ncbi:DUF4190 domain-containing protein [Streptomyces sp. JB150]|uniref:DUF4190 domain-containing protein n=1 Tax=Streptomyces sp. JB150 TaxID=2714844 RepID=UPI00140ED5A3|nr:DUF4190 domain-containing protein [Streptomyces sp. JB150]QIJ64544.1 DUF4190 domain-containing protein [Streptomyces sp. JB150]
MSTPPPPGPEQPQGPQGQYPAPPPQDPHAQAPHPRDPYAQSPYPQGAYPPGAYPPAPYGAWNPYPHPPRPAHNGVAIAALVLGVLCFLPAVGLVLGLVALRQIKKRGERGRGMAIAGVALSTLGLVLWALAIPTGVASEVWEGFKEGAAEETLSVKKGQCFDSPGGSLEGETYDLDIVDCDGEHDGEAFATVTVPDGSYPGDDRLTGIAEDKCYALQGDYAMDVWAVPDHVDVYYLTPTRQSWRLGDREITCVFGNTDGKGTLTGSLRNDATTLDADQLAYLESVRDLDAVLDREPEAYAEDDLDANTAWAAEVRDAVAAQSEALRAHTWTGDAEQPVAALVEELRTARGHWAKAATAGGPDAFYEHYDAGYAFYDGARTIDVREALGLDTSPPEYDYDGGEDSGGDLDV